MAIDFFKLAGELIILILASFSIYLVMYGLQYGFIKAYSYIRIKSIELQIKKKGSEKHADR